MRKRLAILMAFIIIMQSVCCFTACDKRDAGAKKYDEFITVDVFSSSANYEGIQTGWFAKLVKDRFNMELNIISPNVSGGDTLLASRMLAGNVGDIIIGDGSAGMLTELAGAGLLYDMTDRIEDSEVFQAYPEAVNKAKEMSGNGRIYAMPSQVSSQNEAAVIELEEPDYGAYIRWDYYNEAGAPVIETLEDLLPLMKEIQDKNPLYQNGRKAYAFSLFSDWDSNMMTMAQQPARLYGYEETGFVLYKVDGSDYQSITDTDSVYVRGLKFFFEANRLGILDPESNTQNWDTLWKKYEDGAVYFSPWSWLGPSAYNDIARASAGKGFKYVHIEDTEIITAGALSSGNDTVIGIGSEAKDKQRMFEFIEWLYSPEGILANCAADSGAAGPEGLTWTINNGRCELTEFGKQVFAKENAIIPQEWGGGTWSEGVSALNFKAVLETDINPLTDESYCYLAWDSYKERNTNNLDKSWESFYGVKNAMELCLKKENYIIKKGNDYVIPKESMAISTMRSQCSTVIINSSWDMVYAADEEEFYDILQRMQNKVKLLGYDEVLAFDLDNAKNMCTE